MKAKSRRKKDEVADLRTRTKEFALRIIRVSLWEGLPLVLRLSSYACLRSPFSEED